MNEQPFVLNYVLASCMYGKMPLADIIPEAKRIGAAHIDIWPRVHGNQREQVAEMGNAAFAELLATHEVRLGISTRFDLGPFGLAKEMAFTRQFGAPLIVTGSKGQKGLAGDELRSAVVDFSQTLKPHIVAAEEHGITISIENHSSALIESRGFDEVADRVYRFPASRNCLGALPLASRCGIGGAAHRRFGSRVSSILCVAARYGLPKTDAQITGIDAATRAWQLGFCADSVSLEKD